MKKTLAALIALLALAAIAPSAAPTSAQTVAATRRPLALDDYYAIEAVSDVEVSPDGRYAVYVVRAIDRERDRRRGSLWRVGMAGGEPQRLTQGAGSDSHPRFSPNGRFLAFLSDRAEKTQVFALPSSAGEAFQVTDLKNGVSDFVWAPDSRRLALVAADPKEDEDESAKAKDEERTPPPIVITRLQHKRDGAGYLDLRRQRLYVLDAADALASAGARKAESGKPLTEGPYDVENPAWSPDGRTIAFASDRSRDPDANQNTDIWTLEVATGRLAQVTTDPGRDDNPTWSPDGRRLAYVHMPVTPPVYATPRVLTIAATGGAPADLTGAFDRHVASEPRWAADGQAVYVTLADQGSTPLVRVTLGGQRTTVVDGDIADFEVTRTHAVAVRGLPTRPSEIFAAPLEGGAPVELSAANAALFRTLAIPAAEKIRFKSADGTPVEGWVIKPPEFRSDRKYPLILRIHGGPVDQYTDSFSFERHYLASLGYVVLFTNPRGSSGYGEAFCRAIFADWGNKDYQDVMAGVDDVLAQGYVDPTRLGVGGWSYGGIMTNYIITKTPRFAAAVSGASEADMFSAFGYDDLQQWWIRELGAPWDNVELYRRLSPIMDVKKITTPTLVMCGEKDFRCPLPQSEQLYLSLKTLGKETALIIYPGQSHSISKPSYDVDRLRRYGYWYDKYLLGKAVDPTYEQGSGTRD